MLFFLMTYHSLLSQEIKGKVVNQKGVPIVFANIFISKTSDTTKIIKGTTTDFQGSFILKTKSKLPLYLFASYLGYQTFKTKIDSLPINLNISLSPTYNKLKEVVIKIDKPIKQNVNKTVFSIPKTELRKATTGLSLLNIIPYLNIDENNNVIQTVDRKSVLLLINGVRSDAIDIKTINPKNIAKIEYYDMPPARYQNIGIASVVNIITKEKIQGGNLMFDSHQAISPFVSGDYLLSGKYNHKNSQFSFYYNYSNRNYNKKKYTSLTSFTVNNQTFNEELESQLYPFGYDMHIVKTGYILSKNDYIFNIIFNSKYTKSYDKSSYQIERNNNSNSITGTGNSIYYETEWLPKIDVYFQKKLKHNRQFTFDVVGQIADVNSDYKKNEISNDNSILLKDFSIDHNKKKTIIAEAVYNFDLKKLKFETGVFYQYGTLLKKTDNTFFEGSNRLNQQEARAYISMNGRYKRVNYMLGINNKYVYFKNDKLAKGYNSNKIVYNISLFCNISKSTNLTFIYKNQTNTPSLSTLNEQKYYIQPNFIQQGNSNLKPYNTYSFALMYNYRKTNFISSIRLGYDYASKPIFSKYFIQNNTLVSTYFNGENSKTKYIALFLKHFFFKKSLSISSYISNFHFTNNFAENDLAELNGFYYNLNLSYNYQNFTLNLKLENPYKSIDDYTIQKHNVNSDLNINYKYKKWIFGLGVYMPFEKSYMNSYSLKSKLYKNETQVDIFDSANYFYLKVHYNLNFGKQLFIRKKISNSDNDTGTIKH